MNFLGSACIFFFIIIHAKINNCGGSCGARPPKPPTACGKPYEQFIPCVPYDPLGSSVSSSSSSVSSSSASFSPSSSSVSQASPVVSFPSWPNERSAAASSTSSAQIICSDIVAPKICPNDGIRYFLYTSSNPSVGVELSATDSNTIRNAPFNAGAIKVLIHGFASNYTDLLPILDTYFYGGRVINIIFIDYAPLCPFPCYTEGVQNSVLVGNCTALFFEQLLTIRTDIAVSRIHIIGGSMGAQVGAQTAFYWKKGQVERLTGLEAAFPLYPSSFSNYLSIKKGLAKFVDALHTASGTAGQPLPYADLDFYANGGFSQPGCGLDFGCSHVRSAILFNESINNPFAFKAYPCLPFFPAGVCQTIKIGKPVYFGNQVDTTARGVYGFNTNAQSPYGQY